LKTFTPGTAGEPGARGREYSLAFHFQPRVFPKLEGKEGYREGGRGGGERARERERERERERGKGKKRG